MKLDQQIKFNQISSPANTSSSPSEQQPSYFVWEQHNVTLIRSQNYGYGIAISGGLGLNNLDSSIYISDIVPGGPAENKLIADDILLSVNGVNVENVEHAFVIKLLKEAKDFIHLVIKRKINNTIVNNQLTQQQQIELNKRHNLAIQQTAATLIANYTNQTNGNILTNGGTTTASTASMNNNNNSTNGNNLMSQMMSTTTSLPSLKPIKITLQRKDKKEQFGVVLGCKYYIKEILEDSVASNETNLRKGDIVLKINDLSYDHVSLYQANKIILKSKESKLNFVVKRNSLSSINSIDEEMHSDETSSQEMIHVDTLDNKMADFDAQQTKAEQPPQPPPRSHSRNSYNHPISNEQCPSTPSNNFQQYVNNNEEAVNKNEEATNNKDQQLVSSSSGSFVKQLFKPIKPNQPASANIEPNRVPKFYPKTAVFARENGIGIRLAGGNKVGIFICDVQYNSPAERSGLRIADKIIKVNGVDYCSLTREEAVQHILSIHSLIEMVVAYSKEEYDSFALDPSGGDSFYVRAHFNYASKNANDLSFKINDILHVTDTLYNGVIGQWVACKLVCNSNMESSHLTQDFVEDETRGTIPNQTNAEQFVTNAQTIEQSYTTLSNQNENETNGLSRLKQNNLASLGASARMSIRKKLAGKKDSLAKRSKSASRSTANSDNESSTPVKNNMSNSVNNINMSNVKVTKANTFVTDKYPGYEKVVLQEVNFVRPVVIFGPLADVAREKLRSESPQKFDIPDSYSTNPNDPGMAQSSGVIKLASIKEIIEKGRHCLLDITPNAVDHLNYAQYFPICIYLKSQSRNHTKELRQKYAKNLRAKSSRRLHENAQKLQAYYSHLFTATVPLDSNQWFKKVKEIIELQQSQPLWIAQDLEKAVGDETCEPQQQQRSSNFNESCNQNQQQFINKQNQLIFHGSINTDTIHHTVSNSTPISNYNNNINNSMINNLSKNRCLFDDNFELPIYTSANNECMNANGLSISGAASTYSLYEDNNNFRCSYAASDSDICTSSLLAAATNPIGNKPKDNMANDMAIYSTNFKSNASNSVIVAGAVPVVLTSNNSTTTTTNDNVITTSSPSLSSSSSNVMQQHQQQFRPQVNYNNYVTNGMNKQSNNGYASHTSSSHNMNSSDWKKFATYSANSFRQMQGATNATSNDTTNYYQSPNEVIQQQYNQKLSSNRSTPISLTKNNSRPALNEQNFMPNTSHLDVNNQHNHQSDQYFRRLSTSGNNEPVNESPIKNSYATSTYKLIKNSQSTLPQHPTMPPPPPPPIPPSSLLLTTTNTNVNSSPLTDAHKQVNKQLSTGSLLQAINSNKLNQLNNELIDTMNDLKLNRQNVSATKLSEKNQFIQNDLNLIKRKKDVTPPPPLPAKPAPPTLPKPKFILPQPSSATNLVLQRNLKSKSELNIAASIIPSSFSASSTSSTSSEISTSSSSSSNKQKKPTNSEINQINQHQEQSQQNLLLQHPLLKNKILENSSFASASSSQGFHSDTWDSHSSRQSFEIENNAILSQQRYKTYNKLSKLATESKIAKTSLLTNVLNTSKQLHQSETNNGACSDGGSSLNGGIASGDDADSIPNSNIMLNGSISNQNGNNILIEKPISSSTSSTVSTSSNSSGSSSSNSSNSSSSAVALSGTTTLSSNSSNSFTAAVASNNTNGAIANDATKSMANKINDAIELPIYYQTSTSPTNINSLTTTTTSVIPVIINNGTNQQHDTNNITNTPNKNQNSYSDLYSSTDPNKYRITTYTAHYNDNGFYRKLSLDSNSNCSIIASANGIFDCNGGILESADTGVSLNVPEGAIAKGCSFDLYFKVCHCKSPITNGKGELLTNPIVMCGPRGIKFLKPIELQIPHFISIDGQSWSYAFKTNENLADDQYSWSTRFHKKTLLNSVTVLIDSF